MARLGMRYVALAAIFLATAGVVYHPAKAGRHTPHASYVVVVMMENRDYDLIVGSSQAPYINGTLVPEAALMTNSHAVTHPSQPNYLAFFSGSTQGINDDSCPHSFSSGNAAEELIAAGQTFDGYSESMPYNGYTGCSSGEYARKHNPWVNFDERSGDIEPRVRRLRHPAAHVVDHRSEPLRRHARLHARRWAIQCGRRSNVPAIWVRQDAQRSLYSHVGRSRSRCQRTESDRYVADRAYDQARQVRPAHRSLFGASYDRSDCGDSGTAQACSAAELKKMWR